MAKTLISQRGRGERGVALLEAAIALAIVSLLAAAAYSVFSQSAAISARAAEKLEALAAAEMAIELASLPAFLAQALADGAAEMNGEDWRVQGRIYEEDDPKNPLALIRLTATSGPDEAPIVTLETLRSLPR